MPCHRVIGSTGSLIGYGGGLDRKQRLLAFEGADGAAGRGAHVPAAVLAPATLF